jgi:acyl-CoA synthetase (AMP-forming)/AMP-acid ligase II
MTITEILSRNARMYGPETALIEREPARRTRREISWSEFNLQAGRVARVLKDRGVKKGDKVVQLMMNCLEWLPVYFGILRTGAWAAPLNFRFTEKEIAFCCSIAESKVLIFGEEFIDRINLVKNRLQESITHFLFVGPEDKRPDYAEPFLDVILSGEPDTAAVAIQATDPAALYFTSGTTGTPKAVLLTHQNLEASCVIENRHHHQTRDDTFLCIPPLYHTGAKMHWFGHFLVGSKAVILKGVKPGWILEAVSEERCTVVWLLVPWAHDILIALDAGDLRLRDYRLDQWRLMHIGAQPVPPSLIRRWKEVFPNHAYDTNYGLTEATGPGCVHLGIDHLHKVGAIGVPGFGWQCRIVGDGFKPLSNGATGELAVKGPGVMKEYYRNPDATAATLVDGWLLTGDVAKMDQDGFIWLVDRKKDVIISGGENIYPVEIESFLMEHRCIQDVGVIGIPDQRLGEVVAAVIQTKPGTAVTEQEILDFVQNLPRYKRPRRIFFADVPRNPTGKIEKPRMRKQYAAFTD